jgi:glutaredoxin 3
VPQIRIYTTPACPYCVSAKRFLRDRKGVPFEEIDVARDPVLRQWLVDTTHQRTVPQIFIGDVHVGGYTDMRALDNEGGLDPLLGSPT